MYIPGTRNASDYLDDMLIPDMWLPLPNSVQPFRLTAAYRDAERLYLQVHPKLVVGHSLGAAVAQELARTFGVRDVGVSSPVINLHNYADPRDPVGVLVRSQARANKQVFLHHGISDFQSINRRTVSPKYTIATE